MTRHGKALYNTPEWLEHFEQLHEFADQELRREEEMFGPRSPTLSERSLLAKQRRLHREIEIENLRAMCDVNQAAKVLSISPGLVREMINSGELHAERFGRKGVIRIPRREIEKRLGRAD